MEIGEKGRCFNEEMLVLRRESLGLTQSSVADQLGISQGRLSRIEGGLIDPDEALVEDMSRVLKRPKGLFLPAGSSIRAGNQRALSLEMRLSTQESPCWMWAEEKRRPSVLF